MIDTRASVKSKVARELADCSRTLSEAFDGKPEGVVLFFLYSSLKAQIAKAPGGQTIVVAIESVCGKFVALCLHAAIEDLARKEAKAFSDKAGRN